jgi:hypothetical protein
MGLSVRSFVASRFYERFAQPGGPLRPTALDEFRRQTGLNSERDLDQLVVATGRAGEVVMLGLGRLDRRRIVSAWRQRVQQGPPYRLALLRERALVIGSEPWVEAISGRIAGADLRANPAMLALVQQVPEHADFWMVGEGAALSRLTVNNTKGPTAGLLPLGLPPLRSVVIAGKVDDAGDAEPFLRQTIQADAEDERSARSLADMLRGFIALTALQSQSRPALRDLSTAVEVTAQGATVRLAADLTNAMLEALIPRSGGDAGAAQVAPRR